MDEEAAALRCAMQIFVDERLKGKLAKLKPDDAESRKTLAQQHELDVWLADAARRVSQIRLATHIVKPMHPDAQGTNLHVEPTALDEPGLVGTHSVPHGRADDVVGNAAALDVYKFLSLEHAGRTLLSRVVARDVAFKAALCSDPQEAEAMVMAFAGITEPRGKIASHALAKQLYFPIAPGEYHLLGPLFPTSLVHHAQSVVREHRFGEAAKAARDARKKNEPWHEGFHEYPDLAIQKFGGTKPQNISQLNSERHGENWLLSSLPPQWKSRAVVAPLHVATVFERRFGRQRRVRELVGTLRAFLSKTTYSNVNMRNRRAELVREIGDEVLQYASVLRALPPGWSASSECKLVESERLWLDPGRVLFDEPFAAAYRKADWPAEVCARFANWLNSELSTDRMLLGDAEHHEWARELRGEIDMLRDQMEPQDD